MPTIPQGPYARAAHDYRRIGWPNPIPVRGKDQPPKGYTGKQGIDVDVEDITRWSQGPEGRDNISLRLHDGIIAIDVDAHDGKEGADTIAKAQADLGELPPTWSSTSRGKTQPSRILLYRVPLGLDWSHAEANLIDRYGRHVDILHRGHRYAMVSPSQHPVTGAVYLWHDPEGEPSARAPAPTQLTELPPAWIKVLIEPPPTHDPDPGPRSAQEREGRPGDDLNQRGTWAEILEPLGWTWCFKSSGLDYWRQPDHAGRGHSATTGIRPSGLDLLVNFSTSVPLKTSKAMTRFSVYAELHHGGDRSAAAKALADRGYGRDRNQANTIDGELGVIDLLEIMGEYQHLDDPWVVWFVLAVAVSAFLDGDPLWGMPIGPSSGGKTEAIRLLDDLAEHLGELTNAGLLSWTKGKDPRPCGALHRIGEQGLITISDFSTVLATSDRGGRDQLFSNLRLVYDGELPRNIAGPYPLIWKGKATLLAGCTPAIDRFSSYTDQLGPRWLFFRLAEQDSKAARLRAARAQQAAVGIDQYRAKAQAMAAAIVRGAVKQAGTVEVPQAIQKRLVDVAYVACLGRASVPRHGYGRREIDGLPNIESPPRLTLQLTKLARGLLTLGLDEPKTLWLCEHAALSSMPSIRLRVLQVLADGEELSVSEAARRARGDRKPIRFALEELQTIGVAGCDQEEGENEFPDKRNWRLDGPDSALVADVIAGHPWDEKWEQYTPTHKDRGSEQTEDINKTEDGSGFKDHPHTSSQAPEPTNPTQEDVGPSPPVGGQIFPTTTEWDAAGRPGLSTGPPAYQCDRCGTQRTALVNMAGLPHPGCPAGPNAHFQPASAP